MTDDHGPSGAARRLTLSRDRKLGGVCGGIAEYLDLDPTIVRVVFIVLLLFPFFPFAGGVLLYLVLWLVLPAPGAPATAAAAQVPPLSAAGGRDSARLLGGLLVVVGVLFLLQRLAGPWWLGWWMPHVMTFGWPVLLILIGGLILLSASNRRRS